MKLKFIQLLNEASCQILNSQNIINQIDEQLSKNWKVSPDLFKNYSQIQETMDETVQLVKQLLENIQNYFNISISYYGKKFEKLRIIFKKNCFDVFEYKFM